MIDYLVVMILVAIVQLRRASFIESILIATFLRKAAILFQY